jgi:transposase-like protein
MGAMRQRRRADWRELVSEQARSGQGVTAFCRERGIRTSSLYAWRKQLGVVDERKAEVPTDRSSSAGSKAAAETPMRFLEVKMATASEPIRSSLAPAPIIEVRLPRGRSLMVAPGFDAIHLQQLLAVLDPAVPEEKSSPAVWQAGL